MKIAGSLSETAKEKAWYELVGVPFDGNAIKKGARYGPQAIRRASQRLETFLWAQKRELTDLLYYDRGNLTGEQLTGTSNWLEPFDPHTKRVFLGGDHSISYYLVKRLFEANAIATVIVIDAHADFRDSYKDNRYSNASVVRRIAELVGFEQVIELGVRSASEEEYRELNGRIRLYDAAVIRERGVAWLISELGKDAEKTYLSIDLDVLDPSISPGVEHPEPSGFALDELIALLQGVLATRDVVASDVVEVNPRLDCANALSSLHAARVVFELLACYGRAEKRY
jgi:agmatinase